jgi:hypothetical protein
MMCAMASNGIGEGPAPGDAVWPWVAQVGYCCGSWYTNARLAKLLVDTQ